MTEDSPRSRGTPITLRRLAASKLQQSAAKPSIGIVVDARFYTPKKVLSALNRLIYPQFSSYTGSGRYFQIKSIQGLRKQEVSLPQAMDTANSVPSRSSFDCVASRWY